MDLKPLDEGRNDVRGFRTKRGALDVETKSRKVTEDVEPNEDKASIHDYKPRRINVSRKKNRRHVAR